MSAQATAARAVRLVTAELVLVVGLAVSVAAGLAMVVGPNGLGLVDFGPRWPVVGTSQYVMSVETAFDTDAQVRVMGAPDWRDTPTGTVDARTGGRPVEVTGPFSGYVGFPGPSVVQRWAWVAWQAASPLLIALTLWLVLRLVRSVREGDPFTATNAARLRRLALVLALGGTAVSVAGAALRRWLLDSSGAANIVAKDWQITVLPLFLGLIVGVLAQVWNRGVEMKDDLDGVV